MDVPTAQPEETVYGVCARAHWTSGAADPALSSTALLGHRRGGAQHVVPFGLKQLERASEGAVPANEAVLRQRTVLRAYMPFMSLLERGALVRAIVDGAPRSAAHWPGGFQSLFAGEHELRYCRNCFEIDRASLGFGVWHVGHQLPGVWVCPTHEVPLAFVRPRPRKRLDWILVEEAAGVAEALPPLTHINKKALWRVAVCCNWIGACERLWPEALNIMVRKRLHDEKLLSSELKAGSGEFERVVAHIQKELSPVMREQLDMAAASRWIQETLVDPRATHPLRWAVLLAAAGDVPADTLTHEYMQALERVPQPSLFRRPSRKRSRAPDEIYSVLSGPTTLARAAAALGVSMTELRGWLVRDGDLGPQWRAKTREVRCQAAVLAIEAFLHAHPLALRMDVIRSCLWAVRVLESAAPSMLDGLLPPSTTRPTAQLRLF